VRLAHKKIEKQQSEAGVWLFGNALALRRATKAETTVNRLEWQSGVIENYACTMTSSRKHQFLLLTEIGVWVPAGFRWKGQGCLRGAGHWSATVLHWVNPIGAMLIWRAGRDLFAIKRTYCCLAQTCLHKKMYGGVQVVDLSQILESPIRAAW